MKRTNVKWLMMLVFVLIVALVSGGCGNTPASNSTAKQAFSVGAIFDITGSSSSLGMPERDSVQMLVDQVNAKGGINGHKINLIMLDGKSSESETALAMKRLVEQDKVLAVIGSSTSGPSMSMVPIAQEKQVPMISSAASVKIVAPVAERKWIFKTAQNDDLVAQKIISYLKAKGITNVAF
ncbi:MAG TPA: ABC transporter substrate-binding protein, partial [Verrucomicrobiae bacterium]|nr:ABC transporter substrate-binding protein [Verrucomicrobiae bacterium]